MRPVKLLLVGVAPPVEEGVEVKTIARSATNHAEDNLRNLFILATLPRSWEDLLARGLFLVHSVKCAITVKDRHQNPPDPVVNACAPPHFVQELRLLRPPRVIIFGKAPYRALLKVPGVRAPRGLGVSTSVADLVERTRGGIEFQADGWKFTVHVSPFALKRKRPVPLAQDVLREAATLAGVLDAIG
jgi:uracil-DNA glycosylase